MAEEARDTVSHTLSEMFSSKPNDHEVKKTQPRPHDTSLIKASISCRQMDVDACERISNEARKESSHLGQIWLSLAKERAKEVEKRLEEKEQRRRSATKKEKDLASMYLHQASLAQSQADLEGEEADDEMKDAQKETALGRECIGGSALDDRNVVGWYADMFENKRS
ncbi:hypothetical protein GUITHDRAFT_105386 [Guillardia theta CCMP2712]|uniref:Uncharacterized protein n=1 Tax=Guillardia theta (strain CCMP2712) TaxID=905079 RepID=L1JKB2_GUITC|nr:hypothetical protein GUITHDRAFT_105386 [Guillardia theta CCMP2712]EKX48757.1 hypothetical protein GUITHDRAFT_105386 [Guillardia theta CCMP2712]|eukprot:XP_005835737.1 hypothetical protein GUITHDRAFT_105386 [Guillardia theta CCMP2712]